MKHFTPLWPLHLQPYVGPCPIELASVLEATRPAAKNLRIASIACRCGEGNLLVGVAYNWEVVDAACPACGHEFSLYDPKHHGRAGVTGKNDYERPPFESVPFGCMCRMMLFQLAVALDLVPEGETAESFGYIAIAGRCAACSMPNLVLDAASD